ncbi:hypothetical protein [uncultured Ruminococcus sp.]|uniref:hypothetical protein n=1 Tax=uncultured Ruminococcus sp. TaxID=165186 RepID=UPI002942F0E5|nr:hypothetical protein [uncultured Ruminococcus sp.]
MEWKGKVCGEIGGEPGFSRFGNPQPVENALHRIPQGFSQVNLPLSGTVQGYGGFFLHMTFPQVVESGVENRIAIVEMGWKVRFSGENWGVDLKTFHWNVFKI